MFGKRKVPEEELKEIESRKADIEKQISVDEKIVNARRTLSEERKKLKELESERKHPAFYRLNKTLMSAENQLIAMSKKKLNKVK